MIPVGIHWLTAAIIAATFSGISTLLDKTLLGKKGLGDPLVYTFWAGLFGGLVLFLFPFAPVIPEMKVLAGAVISGFLFMVALFFLFAALRLGEASGAFPIIGGFSPIVTLILAKLFFNFPFTAADTIGFSVIVLGSIILLGVEEKELRLPILFLALASAMLFGVVNVLRTFVFAHTLFVSGVLWLGVGGACASVILFLFPFARSRIRLSFQESRITNKGLFLLNRIVATVGTIILFFAFSLGHPALVDAAQGLRYVVIFFGAWFLLGERFSARILIGKTLGTILIVFGLGWLGIVQYARSLPPPDPARPIVWGVTFSDKFSRELGLGWKENFDAILHDLDPKKLRLIAYWNDIERDRGFYDFRNLDWQIARAAGEGREIVLAIGMKVPRWPECHVPAWAATLSSEEREEALRAYLAQAVKRYRAFPEIAMWQVENEPFLLFGECPRRGRNFLLQEIALVKSLDPLRPVLVTDGGEFGLWYKAIRAGDVFGTTMYRRVFPRFLGTIFGVIDYPIAPSYFRVKERFGRWLTGDFGKRFVVSELQGEPWGMELLQHMPYEEHLRIFPQAYFEETIAFAKSTGFDEYYLWGAEWWYWLKERHHDSSMWDEAKKILRGSNL